MRQVLRRVTFCDRREGVSGCLRRAERAGWVGGGVTMYTVEEEEEEAAATLL